MMSRLRVVSALAVALVFALAGVATAANSSVAKVTGGNTQITLSSTAAQLLSAKHITATPVAPATSSGSTFTFPISGGHVNLTTLNGTIRHKGGLTLSNGTDSITLRELTLIAHKNNAVLFALVRTRSHTRCRPITRKHPHVRCKLVVRQHSAPVARVTGITHTGTTAQGTAHLTEASARLINRLAGSKIVADGEVIGSASTTVSFG